MESGALSRIAAMMQHQGCNQWLSLSSPSDDRRTSVSMDITQSYVTQRTTHFWLSHKQLIKEKNIS